MIPRFDFDLIVANFDELAFLPHDLKVDKIAGTLGFWQKSFLVADRAGYIVIAPAAPSNAASELYGSPQFSELIIPKILSGDVSKDVVNDDEAWSRLIVALSDRGRVRLWAQVFSPGVDALARALRRAGVDVDMGDLPLVSPYTVAFWNTKVGGRDLLETIGAEALPRATLCNSIAEVMTNIAAAGSKTGFVVKADSSVGGSGVWLFPPDSSRTIASIKTTFASDPKASKIHDKRSVAMNRDGPYLVEELIGSLGTNSSPTADFRILESGENLLIGIAEQLLEGGTAYRGSSYPIAANSLGVSQCVSLGRRVCERLYQRGYRGLVNIDYIVPANGEPRIAELNLRQSAPLDQFLVIRRLFGEDWEGHPFRAYICDERVALHEPIYTTRALYNVISKRHPLSDGEAILPLAIYGDRARKTLYASILALGATQESTRNLLSAVRCLLSGGQSL